MKNVNFILCNFGNVLATRAQGERARVLLRERVDEPSHVVLNFAGVDAVTPPFLDELLSELYRVLRRHREGGGLAVVVNANEDDLETLSMVLEHGGWPGLMYSQDARESELISRSPQLAETLRAAVELGPSFTAPQLAELLNLKLPNANHRLGQLVQAGALARRRDDTAERGKRFQYEPPTEDRLGEMLEHGALLTATA